MPDQILEVKYQLIGCFEDLCSEDLDDSAVGSLHYVPTDGASDCGEARDLEDVENWRPLVMQVVRHYYPSVVPPRDSGKDLPADFHRR